MQVAVLGPLEVRDDAGAPVAVTGGRLRALVSHLALAAGRPVAVDTLVDAIWADDPPAEAANALQTLVSRLRRVAGRDAITQSSAGYRLASAPDDVDAVRFERHATAGAAALRVGDHATARAELDDALALWSGPALSDAGPGADADRTRLDARAVAARADRAEVDLLAGAPADAAAALAPLVADHPLDERLAALQVRALAAAGRQADALHAYERLRTSLADELGVDPSPEVQAVHLSVLRGEFQERQPEPRRAVRRTNLRAQLTSFVGRDDEVAAIAKALGESRLVTLVGPGGAGKTRLAAEAVERIVDSVPDGVWFVELASVSDAADLPQTVLGSLGIRENRVLDRPTQLTARDALTRLVEGLAEQSAVIVLDNCEHLVEASARLADALLSQCPDLRILATSREPLAIFGEALFAVPPLSQPDRTATPAEAMEFAAVRLFADRAAHVQPGFAIDDDTVGTVVEIVRRLDGLPLAIELAAARLRTVPLADIAHRLSDRFRLLTGGSRTALPRHRTLRAVVEWSWELLTEPERLLAERLAVFPAGATTESATVVCAHDAVPAEDIPDLLSSLVDKSLLQPVRGGERVRMLETIREFGVEQIAERGELGALRVAHADYFADLMARVEPHLRAGEQLHWMHRAGDERDNILAAMRYRCDTGDADGALRVAIGMGVMAMMLGNHSDVAVWLHEALVVPGWTDDGMHLLGEAIYAVNAVGDDFGTNADSIEHSVQRVQELLAPLDHVAGDVHPMCSLIKTVLAMLAEDDERLQHYMDEALASDDPWTVAAAYMFRSNVAENVGDVDAVRADAEEGLRRFRLIGDRWGIASCLRSVALVRTLDRDLLGAQLALEEGLVLIRELGSQEDETFILMRLADLALRRGDIDTARAIATDARQAHENRAEGFEHVFAVAMLAEIERQDGNQEQARELIAGAVRTVDAISQVHPMQGHGAAMVYGAAARIALDDDDLETARGYAIRAVTLARGTRDQAMIAAIGVTTAVYLLHAGMPEAGARALGAGTRLRGAADPTDEDVVEATAGLREQLGDAGFDAAYAEGLALDHEAAQDALDLSVVAPG